jgi:hypothetical protein
VTTLLLAVVAKVTAGYEAGATLAPALRQAQGRPEHSRGAVAPPLLSQTGLYAGEGTLHIDPRNRPFSPQYPLWSDGAAKRRWIHLPDGAAIDATDLSRWDFPIGTRFWKEFSFDGHKVETRFLWRVSKEQWVFASIADCRSCHDSARTEILGFDALNLSDDRDPNAPHAEPLTREMITLRTLTEERLLTPKRHWLVKTPPRIQR